MTPNEAYYEILNLLVNGYYLSDRIEKKMHLYYGSGELNEGVIGSFRAQATDGAT